MKRLLIGVVALLLLASTAQAQQVTALSTTACPGAGCVTLSVAGQGSLGIQISQTFVGTISFTQTINGTDFTTLTTYANGSTTGVTSTTTTGYWTGTIAGARQVRIAFTAYTSGTALVSTVTTSARLNFLLGTGVGVLAADHGGTGQSSYAIGDLLYADSTTSLAKRADVAAGSVLVSGGVGAAPVWSANPSATTFTATTGFLTADGTAAAPSLTFASDPTTGISYRTAGGIGWVGSAGSVGYLRLDNSAGRVLINTTLGFARGDVTGVSADAFITAEAANTIACRNGTNACTQRIYGTYTDQSNYERLSLVTAAGTNQIILQKAGTGAARNLEIGTTSTGEFRIVDAGTSVLWKVVSNQGHWLAGTDNIYDIGANGANRPRNYFGGGSVIVPELRGTTSITLGSGGRMAFSSASPTISSGFGSSPSIAANNGTAAFTVNIGTGGTASSGVIGLPTATTGWVVACQDLTTPGVNVTKQTAVATNAATITNYNSTTGIAAAWTAGDTLYCQATAF